jgi:hypothetical protein
VNGATLFLSEKIQDGILFVQHAIANFYRVYSFVENSCIEMNISQIDPTTIRSDNNDNEETGSLLWICVTDGYACLSLLRPIAVVSC